MSAALERHDALLRAAIEAGGGHVFKTVGDAFYAAFAQPLDALNAALAAQRALLSEDWTAYGPEFPALRVRIGSGADALVGGQAARTSISVSGA
jgi:class 3 adenylate cyclase